MIKYFKIYSPDLDMYTNRITFFNKFHFNFYVKPEEVAKKALEKTLAKERKEILRKERLEQNLIFFFPWDFTDYQNKQILKKLNALNDKINELESVKNNDTNS